MGENEITGIGGLSHFAEHLADPGQRLPRREERVEARLTDRVDLTEPQVAALALLRQRVLVRTQQALELPDVPPHPRFHEPPRPSAEAFLGRLLGEQAQLASARDRDWPADRIQAAVADGMTLGTEDTLEILHELDQLDEACWRLVCGVLAAWAHKVTSAG